ncbi:uncharacterized protein LOC123260077 isoform X2 [Cotesia glomerata]|uniref:uncharacterized protein LOC123260077 isoform X2 n=1 Tax=Cotesia glomerata TaxID=32391 RepID=UPI001D0216F2|nr:uncharacterized protein LOC123260077 isoform X2 [Cotesia glomerata]
MDTKGEILFTRTRPFFFLYFKDLGKKQMSEMEKVEDKAKAEHLKILLKNAREAIKAYEEAQKGEPSTPKIPPITGDGEAVVANDGEMDKENTENEKDKEDKTEKKSRIGGAVSS